MLPVLIYCRNEWSMRLCTVTENINEEGKSRNTVSKPDAQAVFNLKNNGRGTTVGSTYEQMSQNSMLLSKVNK